jgi:hypothetical protein
MQVEFGTLKPVRPSERPTRWGHTLGGHMQGTGKHTSRRIVQQDNDCWSKNQNKAIPRPRHPTKTLFEAATAIPAWTYKTVVNSKDGYHSIPLAKEDRKHTTFINPWGRCEYCMVLNGRGLISAGDAYCLLYDSIIKKFLDIKWAVDDTCLHNTKNSGQ